MKTSTIELLDYQFENKDNFGYFLTRKFLLNDPKNELASQLNQLFSDYRISDEYIIQWHRKIEENKMKFSENLSLGPFQLNKLDLADFIKISFDELTKYLQEFSMSDDWGVDLTAYLYLKDEFISKIRKLNLEEFDFYILNSNNELIKEKKMGFDRYCYFILILLPIVNEKIIYCFELGED